MSVLQGAAATCHRVRMRVRLAFVGLTIHSPARRGRNPHAISSLRKSSFSCRRYRSLTENQRRLMRTGSSSPCGTNCNSLACRKTRLQNFRSSSPQQLGGRFISSAWRFRFLLPDVLKDRRGSSAVFWVLECEGADCKVLSRAAQQGTAR